MCSYGEEWDRHPSLNPAPSVKAGTCKTLKTMSRPPPITIAKYMVAHGPRDDVSRTTRLTREISFVYKSVFL